MWCVKRSEHAQASTKVVRLWDGSAKRGAFLTHSTELPKPSIDLDGGSSTKLHGIACTPLHYRALHTYSCGPFGSSVSSTLRHCKGVNLCGIPAVETYYNVANNSKCRVRDMVNSSGAHLTDASYPYVMRTNSSQNLRCVSICIYC